jgi:hypothetical protein
MPSIRIGKFRLSIVNEGKPTYQYSYNGQYQVESLGLRARDEKIYELQRKGLTQEEIGKKVGLGQARVSTILNKKFNVRYRNNKKSQIELEFPELL